MRRPRIVSRRRFSLRLRASWILRALLYASFAFSPFVANHARAHRPNESTAQLRWDHQRLEAQLVLSLPMASLLLADPDVPLINPQNFPAVRERLRLRLIESFHIESTPDGAAPSLVVPIAELTALSLAPDGDVLCSLVFPLETPAPLRVHAAFLSNATPDSFCWIRIWSGADRLVAQKLLVRNEPRAGLPAPSAEPAAPATTAPITPSPKS